MVVAAGDAVRDADTIRLPGAAPSEPDPTVVAAAARLVELLDTSSPPPLSAAVSESGCPADAARDLERDGRIVVVDDDLAWSRTAYDDLEATALALARQAPMTPAALRDATGTSRKYVMALLEDLSRRAVLTRTPDGHVPGPRA